jgi:rubrerythrin
MSTTPENLAAAFAGESQASRKYLAFARKADEEGFAQAARLFRAAAAGETVHAQNHFRAMGGVLSTLENLKEARNGENYEVESMYPPMIAEAEAKGDTKAARSFTLAFEVEKVHSELYGQMIANLGKPGEEVEYYVCPVCGHLHAGKAPEKCPVCGSSGSRYELVK